jgi:hypothetical protein
MEAKCVRVNCILELSAARTGIASADDPLRVRVTAAGARYFGSVRPPSTDFCLVCLLFSMDSFCARASSLNCHWIPFSGFRFRLISIVLEDDCNHETESVLVRVGCPSVAIANDILWTTDWAENVLDIQFQMKTKQNAAS